MFEADILATVPACILVGSCKLLTAIQNGAARLGMHGCVVGRVTGPLSTVSLPSSVGVFTLLQPDGLGAQGAQHRCGISGAGAAVLRWLSMLKAVHVFAVLTLEGQEVELSALWHAAMLSNRQQVGTRRV